MVKPVPALSLVEQPTAARSLPYGMHLIDHEDIAAVEGVLRRDFLARGLIDEADVAVGLAVLRGPLVAQGPMVAEFENAFAAAVDVPHAVACSSGTSALHMALAGLGIGEGDVCIVPAITFLSTATAARLCNAEVVFADVDPVSGLMTADTLREALARAGGRARGVLPVHLAGRSCAMAEISAVAREHGLLVVEDACHALGTRIGDDRVGRSSLSDATAFSFHPVKTIACGEGGMVTTRDPVLADRLRRLRNHGVTRDAELMTDRELSFASDGRPNPWSYEQLDLGFNYRMTEIEGALGRSQLRKLDRFVEQRAHLARRYDELLASLSPLVTPVVSPAAQRVSLHLYVVHLALDQLGLERATLVRELAEVGVGSQVHYIPVYRQPYFIRRYGPMRLDGAERYYGSALALPLFPAMSDADVDRVVLELARALGR